MRTQVSKIAWNAAAEKLLVHLGCRRGDRRGRAGDGPRLPAILG